MLLVYSLGIPSQFIYIFSSNTPVFPQPTSGYFDATSRQLFSLFINATDVSPIHSSLGFTIFHASLISPVGWSGCLLRIPGQPNSGANCSRAHELPDILAQLFFVTRYFPITTRWCINRFGKYVEDCTIEECHTPCLSGMGWTYSCAAFCTVLGALSICLPFHTTFIVYCTQEAIALSNFLTDIFNLWSMLWY